jgi:SAM-dependent methyltransferase
MWYTTWFCTPYYKLLYGHRDENDASTWVDGIVQRLDLRKGDALLDMACGRGRHVAGFEQKGLKVTGIDLSRESIQEARARCPQAELFVHDMRRTLATGGFQAVVCLFTSLGYSTDREDDQRSVNAAAEALAPGGALVLDLMNTARVRKELVAEEHLEAEGVRFHITRTLENSTVVKRIHVLDGEDELRFVERVHAFTPVEVDLLMERAGLRIFDRTDGPPFGPFDTDTSERLVIWARKPR